MNNYPSFEEISILNTKIFNNPSIISTIRLCVNSSELEKIVKELTAKFGGRWVVRSGNFITNHIINYVYDTVESCHAERPDIEHVVVSYFTKESKFTDYNYNNPSLSEKEVFNLIKTKTKLAKFR